MTIDELREVVRSWALPNTSDALLCALDVVEAAKRWREMVEDERLIINALVDSSDAFDRTLAGRADGKETK